MIKKHNFTSKNTEEIFETLNKIREANYDFDISEQLLADLIEELQFWQDEQDIVFRKKWYEEFFWIHISNVTRKILCHASRKSQKARIFSVKLDRP